MEKKQIKINGKIAVEIKINGGLFWKAGGTEPSEPNKLVYSAKSAGSTITVNGETVTLEQGDNITLDYPNEITSVKATYNTALTYIQIPNTVTSISLNGFNGCSSLSSIIIPESVTSIERAAFGSCSSLSYITIPSSVTKIGDYVFIGCSSLSSITIPDGIRLIGSYTFSSCSSLEYVNIPNSVTVIKSYAFENCRNMKYINYSGTMAQWGAIRFQTNWKLNNPVSVVHCTDGDVNI